MGTNIIREKGLGAALNNCAFVSTDDIEAGPSKPFTFLMDACMLGVGVGFDTEGTGKVPCYKPTQPARKYGLKEHNVCTALLTFFAFVLLEWSLGTPVKDGWSLWKHCLTRTSKKVPLRSSSIIPKFGLLGFSLKLLGVSLLVRTLSRTCTRTLRKSWTQTWGLPFQ
jgi:hypothetical protein